MGPFEGNRDRVLILPLQVRGQGKLPRDCLSEQ